MTDAPLSDPILPQYKKPAHFAHPKQAAPLMKMFKNMLRRGKNRSNSQRRKKVRVV